MNGFERRKQQKRESISRAALTLFQAHGFRRVSIVDIAKRANVSQVSIYNHFNSKEELMREVIKKFLLDILADYGSLFKSERPFIKKLEYMIFRKEQVAAQFNGELMGPVVYNDPQLMQFVDTVFKKMSRQIILDLVEEGRKQGYISKDLSNEAVLIYFELLNRGMQSGAGELSKIKFTPKLVREINSLVLYGLNG